MSIYTFEILNGTQFTYEAETLVEALKKFKEHHPFEEWTIVWGSM